MRKITLFVIIFFLATFGTVREVESYEIWGCCCCPNWKCEWSGLPCCCDMEEFGDDSGDKGCGLVWPAVDAVGDDEYCEIVPPGNKLDWDDRRNDCKNACDTTCTHDDDCDSNICGELWQNPSDDTCTTCDTGSECTQGYEIMAKLEMCPSTSEYMTKFGDDPDGYTCVLAIDKGWDPFTDAITFTGKWDASEERCISCNGKKEDLVYANIIAIYTASDELSFDPKTRANHGKCETACSEEVDSACDEVAEGGLCKAGELCESLGVGVTCSGTEKCVDCKCERKTCGNGKVDPGEECDGDIDTKAEGATKDCEGLCAPPGEADECTCRSATCGNGVIDPGEECDGNVDTIAEGATKDCEGKCVRPDKSPLPCHCQICGNNRIEYPEECDPPGSACSGGTCNSNCVCVGAPPAGPDATCTDTTNHYTDTIAFDEKKKIDGGVIHYRKEFSGGADCDDGAWLDVTPPGAAGPVSPSGFWDGDTHDYSASGGTETYYVKLVDAKCGSPSTVDVEVWCEVAGAGEICNNGIDEPDCPVGAPFCEQPADADNLIDCEDPECPDPDACTNPCQEDVCCDVDGEPGCPAVADYQWHCKLKPGAKCAVPDDCPPPGNPGDYECPIVGTTVGVDMCICVPLIEVNCSNGVDDDGDGCTDGEDVDCGGNETDCFDVIDNNCDGETDCADPDCRFTAPDCNDCQNLTCNADGTWQWSCPTKAGAECSSNTECWATTKWCNLETCNCEEPPPTLASKWRIEDVACRIIVLLQEIVAGIATLIIVYAGIKWMGSGVTDPVARQEAADMIKAVFVGLVIIIVALQFINYMFGNELGTVSCPVNVTWHNMVIICDVPYMCDDTNSDGICPEDFGITCDVPDKDC
ncbi:MAG TPA: hypothetical protein ENG12_02755 [Candidatus Altiarchaeales archaeon]|nr:hypothetical protein [Candidatus Altiarchaeales archaeon]